MYSIYADDLLIYSDTYPAPEVKVIDPLLELADSAAGKLEMTLPPTNVGYSSIQRMTTDIIVKCDDEEIWSGRVLDESYDFWNNRVVTCEGELAFLNDTIQPPHQYLAQDTTISSFLTALITIHNAKVDARKQFTIGQITVNDGDQLEDDDHIYRYTNYETTLECINDKLVSRLGGHIRIRKVNGVRYLDYISDETIGANSQIIRFGENLMDFAKGISMSEICTVIVPRGHALDEEEIEGLTSYLTVASLGEKTEEGKVWHESGSIYVKNPDAEENFGRFEYVIDWDNVTDPENLYSKAVTYLKDEQYEKMTLEIKALDLHYLSVEAQRIRILDKLRCISTPHNMDHTFPVTKMSIRLDSPDNSLYTLGTDVPLTLTQSNSKTNQNINDKIDNIPSKSSILKAAQENAFQIINGVSGSYVHFVTKEMDPNKGAIMRIEVTDGPTIDTSLNRWIFNSGGLGHLGRSDYQTPWDDIGLMDVAMTMDGGFVADHVTTGTLRAQNDNYTLDMATGHVVMKDGDFKGKITSTSGKIANFDISIDKMTRGNAVLSEDYIGCGEAGHGGVLLMGGTSANQDPYVGYTNMGCVQIGNAWDYGELYDGIRIYGDGKVQKIRGDGSVAWEKWLSNIPSS